MNWCIHDVQNTSYRLRTPDVKSPSPTRLNRTSNQNTKMNQLPSLSLSVDVHSTPLTPSISSPPSPEPPSNSKTNLFYGSMFAEFAHTAVDSINQSILLFGARQSETAPSHKFNYGLGKATYFFSLISAMNVLWFGCFFSIYHSISHALSDSIHVNYEWYSFFVLLLSGAVDGFVLRRTLAEIMLTRKTNESFIKTIQNVHNPLLLTTLLEDAAALLGVALAFIGAAISYFTNNHLYDTAFSISIGILLGAVAFRLICLNHKFLLGRSIGVSRHKHIESLLIRRPTISKVFNIKAEWISVHQFALRFEIDFNGYAFGESLREKYKKLFKLHKLQLTHEQFRSLLQHIDLKSKNPELANQTLSTIIDEFTDHKSLSKNNSLSLVEQTSPYSESRSKDNPSQFNSSNSINLLLLNDSEFDRIIDQFAEDVTHAVEREVVLIEKEIQKFYPQAAYIEIEPSSSPPNRKPFNNYNRPSFGDSERDPPYINRKIGQNNKLPNAINLKSKFRQIDPVSSNSQIPTIEQVEDQLNNPDLKDIWNQRMSNSN